MKVKGMKTRKTIVFFLMMSVLFIALSACNTQTTTTTPMSVTSTAASSATATATTSPTAKTAATTTSTITFSAAAVQSAYTLMGTFDIGWMNKDPDILSPLYGDEVKGFDAMEPNWWSYNKQAAETMLRSPEWWKQFDVHKGSRFVSQDGRFVATVTTMDFFVLDRGLLPNANVIALKDGKVVYQYDYYGSVMSKTEKLQVFEPMTIDPGSTDAQRSVGQAYDTVSKWRKAYNVRNAEAYLSCFADDAKVCDVVKPDWRTMAKSELSTSIASLFSNSAFRSKLEAPTASPITDGFFISADGRYAAVQGSYEIQETAVSPMLVILEMKAGKIVKQYNYLFRDQNDLQP